jgi:multidrug efflux pump subunit AcrB
VDHGDRNGGLFCSRGRRSGAGIDGDPLAAALEVGFVRFRPVLMTALAFIGMVPMALGLGEGGEQNAPLGRAAIGGLGLATVATLIFVPVVFSIMHRKFAGASSGEPHVA